MLGEEAMELSRKQAIGLLLIAGLVWMGLGTPTSMDELQASLSQGQGQGTVQNTQANQNNQNTQSQVNQGNQNNQEQNLPVYQVSEVNMFIKNALDKASGISGLEVETFSLPQTYSQSDLANIASDPDRDPLDEDTNTTSAGKASFSEGKINTNTQYLYSIRGDSATYDKLLVRKVSTGVQEFSISPYTFPENPLVYKVGSFGDPDADGANTGDNTIDAGVNSVMNVTGSSGSQYVTTTFTIGEADTGKVLKEPVLVLRSTDGQELEPGDIESIYLTRKQGTSFDIPGKDLTKYITQATPIKLGGSLYDEDEGVYYMGVQDSGQYTVKLSFDADQIEPAGDQLELVLDDLGEYNGRDVATADTKASKKTLTFDFQS